MKNEYIIAAVNFIESNLKENITLHEVAGYIGFSENYFHSYFKKQTNLEIKNYIRKRKISNALKDLVLSEKRIIDVCYDYSFNSPEVFTRAVKRYHSITASEIQKKKNFVFFEKYSDKSKIKNKTFMTFINPGYVVFSQGFGYNPEDIAWKNIFDGCIKNNPGKDLRIFGYNSPSPLLSGEPYGYEFIILSEQKLKYSGKTKIKYFPGGFYTCVSTDFQSLVDGWSYFNSWNIYNSFKYGDITWLEEHFPEKNTTKNFLKIYYPLKKYN